MGFRLGETGVPGRPASESGALGLVCDFGKDRGCSVRRESSPERPTGRKSGAKAVVREIAHFLRQRVQRLESRLEGWRVGVIGGYRRLHRTVPKVSKMAEWTGNTRCEDSVAGLGHSLPGCSFGQPFAEFTI